MSGENKITRREFIKTATVAGVGAAAATLAGASTISAHAAAIPEKWDYETDVVVVGYGGGAWFSIITAADAGAKVIALEKAPEGGGSTRMAGCFFTIATDAKGAAEYHQIANGIATPVEVSQAWGESLTKIPAWFDKYGVKYKPFSFGGTPAGADFKGWKGADALASIVIDGNGPVFYQTMDKLVRDRGVQVMLGTPAKQLVQNPETKEVLGVLAEKDSKTIAIKAKRGVVLASGGFENNPDMKANFLRPDVLVPVGWKFNTGDGVKMAQQVGADLWHMNLISSSGQTFMAPGDETGYMMLSVRGNNFIWTDRFGERWICENPAPMGHRVWVEYDQWDWSGGQKDAGFKAIPMYFIFDETARLAGGLGNPTGYNQGSTSIPRILGGTEVGWSKDNSLEVEKGWIKKANTIEELAKALGKDVDPAKLADTVKKYNEYCAAGQDPDFKRDPKSLAKIEKPPFYGIEIYPGIYTTCGGPRKNEKSQVLDVNHAPIPRLYVAGVLGHSAAHVYSTFGQNMAENFFSGTLSGQNVAAEKPWDGNA